MNTLRNRIAIASFSVLALLLAARAQVSVTTHHNDNARTGQNTKELVLNPANVNVNQFGKVFTQPVDGMIVGQPLYLSNVSIPGAGTHNVVYVATQHDSVYAFDADNNRGANAAPLWRRSFINPSAGITSVPIADQSCGKVTRFTEIGIVATPVIDLVTGTLYVIVKTEENGEFVHRLHALDVATGQEKLGGPVTISASVSVNNQVVSFNDKNQMARPALLLANGVVYIAFGSLGCNNPPSVGWVLAYDATTLRQLGIFNTAPDQSAQEAGPIWQAGAGPASDGSNLYVVTAEGVFNGNSDFGDSMLKLKLNSQGLSLIDYFTPFNQSNLLTADLDLGSSGVLLLPDQTGPHPHLLLSGGKEGTIYLVDRDNMGQFNPSSDQVVQSLPSAGAQQRGVSAYWNNQVYIAPNIQFISAYQLSGGQLSTQPVSRATVQFTTGPPSISAKTTTQGILWALRIGSVNALYAFDASNLANNLYNSLQSSPRDDLGTVAHFSVPTVAKGRVYVGGTQQLTVYGLFHALSAAGGNNQSSRVATSLPTALSVLAADSSSGPIAAVPVTFTDGGKGGTFTKTFVKTDSTGIARTNYTLPTKSGIVTITASSPNFEGVTFTVTANPGTATTLVARSGGKQSAPVTNPLPLPVVTKALDIYGNAVAGVPINFGDKAMGGTFSPASVGTDSNGWASSLYTTSTKAGAVTLKGMSTGLTAVSFPETVTAGPISTIALAAGDNQSTPPATQLSQPLVVTLTDPYGNPVPGSPVSFSDQAAGGSFSANPVTSDSHGQATVNYTASSKAGNVSITGSAGGVSSPPFTVTVSAASFSALTLTSGGDQTAQAGTQLSQAFVVTCADQYGNPISGKSVTFSDSAAGGSFSANPVNSDSNGRATVSYTAPTKAGAVTVKAAATGVSSVSFSATVSAGPASTLTLTSGNSQTAQAGAQFSQPLAVTLADQYGNLVSGSAVTFSDNSAGGSFSANPVSSDNNGRATVSYTAPTRAGAVTVKAAATGVSSVSFSATVSAAALSALTLTSGNDQTAQAGTQLSQALVVTCADQYGNPTSGTSVTFSDSAAGGSFSANPVSSDSNGQATVSYTAPTRAGAVTVKAAATGVSSVSFSEAVIAASASALNIISGNNQSGAAGSTLATQLVVQVTDVYGNSVSGTPVSFSDNSAGGSFSTNPIGSDTSGLAGVAYTLPTATGSVTVTAAAPGLASVSFNETAAVGPAAALNKVSGDDQTATPGSPFPLPLVVLVTDQYGNPVSGVAVTFDDAAANGVFSDNPIITDSSGSAGVVYTTPPLSQSISITASVPSLISVVFSETAQ